MFRKWKEKQTCISQFASLHSKTFIWRNGVAGKLSVVVGILHLKGQLLGDIAGREETLFANTDELLFIPGTGIGSIFGETQLYKRSETFVKVIRPRKKQKHTRKRNSDKQIQTHAHVKNMAVNDICQIESS